MDTESLARSLKEHEVTSGLSDDHVAFLSGCAKNVRYAAGEYLFREGQEAAHAYLIRKGKVSLEVHDPARGAIVIESLHAGDLAGWSTIFPPFAWQVDARAVKDALVFQIDGACLRAKLDDDHHFGYAFTRVVLREVHRRLARARLQMLDVYRTSP